MKNINPHYTINAPLFYQLMQHTENLRQKHAKLLAFRMDFFYLKHSSLFLQRHNDWSCCDMYRLAERLLDVSDVIGYCWVMEYTPEHGIHFHAMFYLNGQKHQKYYPTMEHITALWQQITRMQGWVHDCCRGGNHYPVKGQGKFTYSDVSRFDALMYALSYLAKEDQKQNLYCYGLSDVAPLDGRGRPRKDP